MAALLEAEEDEGEEDDGEAGGGGEQDEPGPLTLGHCLLHQLLYLHLLHPHCPFVTFIIGKSEVRYGSVGVCFK